MKDWTIIGLGVISAVIAALAVEWIHRTFHGPTGTANDASWMREIGANPPNFNLAPCNPAFTYQTGAPVTNYRAYQRVGVLEVPAP